MKVAVFSDTHGELIKLTQRVDVVFIVGDITPLNMERDMEAFTKWWNEIYIPYCYDLGDLSTKVIIVPGNHDRALEVLYGEGTHEILPDLYLLINSTIMVGDYKVYGNPYFENLRHWAFYRSELEVYNTAYAQDDVDILLLHCPPIMQDSNLDRDSSGAYYGSAAGRNILRETKPTYMFCGHIHDGDHRMFRYKHFDGSTTDCYNVAIKDDDYIIRYKPLYLEINGKAKSASRTSKE